MKKALIGLAVAVAAPLLLSACSGDDNSTPPAATSQVSPGASGSSAGLAAYIQQLAQEQAAGLADDKEPVDVSTFAPPTPEDTEPEAIAS